MLNQKYKYDDIYIGLVSVISGVNIPKKNKEVLYGHMLQ